MVRLRAQTAPSAPTMRRPLARCVSYAKSESTEIKLACWHACHVHLANLLTRNDCARACRARLASTAALLRLPATRARLVNSVLPMLVSVTSVPPGSIHLLQLMAMPAVPCALAAATALLGSLCAQRPLVVSLRRQVHLARLYAVQERTHLLDSASAVSARAVLTARPQPRAAPWLTAALT